MLKLLAAMMVAGLVLYYIDIEVELISILLFISTMAVLECWISCLFDGLWAYYINKAEWTKVAVNSDARCHHVYSVTFPLGAT